MNEFSSEQRFWITIWAIALPLVTILILGALYISTLKDSNMAAAGYVQKVVVIGDPNDQYKREVKTIWVPKDMAPVVEKH